jgi:predicted CoA-binding protein
MQIPKLRRLLSPESIAVVGVSRNPRNIGHRYLRHLLAHGYPAERIQVVHPTATEILGVPTLSAVGDLVGEPDLALILTAGPTVPELLEELVAHGVGGVNVFANDGPVIDEPERLLATIEGTAVRLLGPNSPGFIATSPPTAAHATQMLAEVELKVGPVGIISHSGAIGGIVGRSLLEANAGFDTLVCTGNEIDLGLGECLHYLAAERDLRAIGLFVETIRDMDHFRDGLRIARERGVKVCALKVGWSEAARRAASAHTGADAGRVDLFEAELRREGATLCHHIDEMVAKLAVGSLPEPRAKGLLIGATSGGLTSLLGDAATFAGLETPELEQLGNPWDTDIEVVHEPRIVGGKWMDALAREEFGAGIFALSAQPDEVMNGLTEGMAARKVDKPFVVIPFAGLGDEATRAFPEESIVWVDAASACEALAWAIGPERAAAESDFDGTVVAVEDARAVLAELGIEPFGVEVATGPGAIEGGALSLRLAIGDHPTYGRYATVDAGPDSTPTSVLFPTSAERLDAALTAGTLGELFEALGRGPLDRLRKIVSAAAEHGPLLLDPLAIPLDPTLPVRSTVWERAAQPVAS